MPCWVWSRASWRTDRKTGAAQLRRACSLPTSGSSSLVASAAGATPKGTGGLIAPRTLQPLIKRPELLPVSTSRADMFRLCRYGSMHTRVCAKGGSSRAAY